MPPEVAFAGRAALGVTPALEGTALLIVAEDVRAGAAGA